MRWFLNVFVLLLIPVLSFGQYDTKDSVYTSVDQMPEFPGGMQALIKYLSALKYPEVGNDDIIQGKVILDFVIDKEGKVKDIKVIRSIGSQLENNMIELIKKMPKWKPGELKGKAVNVKYVLPLTVCISGD